MVGRPPPWLGDRRRAQVGSNSFHEIVFNAIKKDVRQVVLALILREREGELVDRKLIKVPTHALAHAARAHALLARAARARARSRRARSARAREDTLQTRTW